MSFLIRGNAIGDGHFFVMPNASEAAGIGKCWGNGLCVNTHSTTVAMEPGKTYFVVARFDCLQQNDVVHVWINPDLTREPATDAPGVPMRDDASCGTGTALRISAQGYGHGDYDIDEIRLAPTWQQVMVTTDTNPQ